MRYRPFYKHPTSELNSGKKTIGGGGIGTNAAGFTLVELMTAATILVVALVSLAAVFLATHRGSRQLEAETRVVSRAQDLLEDIRGTPPEFIRQTYDRQTYTVTGVEGANPDDSLLSVSVDSTNPKLLRVTITGDWIVDERGHSLVFESWHYNR